MVSLKIKVTITEEMLGMAAANKEIYRDFIAKRCETNKVEDEIEALPNIDEEMEKSMTVFHRDETDNPIMFDYQIKGFFKDNILALQNMDDSPLDTKEKQKKLGLTKYMYKRTMGKLVHITPRKIKLNIPEGGKMGACSRPLRGETMKGERIALAHSETVPVDTTLEFEITILNKNLLECVMAELEYGKLIGLGQWRNSGKGRFTYEIIEK